MSSDLQGEKCDKFSGFRLIFTTSPISSCRRVHIHFRPARVNYFFVPWIKGKIIFINFPHTFRIAILKDITSVMVGHTTQESHKDNEKWWLRLLLTAEIVEKLKIEFFSRRSRFFVCSELTFEKSRTKREAIKISTNNNNETLEFLHSQPQPTIKKKLKQAK